MEVVLIGPTGTITLGFTVVSIGRLPTSQLLLCNDEQVSGKHAEICPTGQGYIVVDQKSTNGTYVNGLRLSPYVPYLLKVHDSIRIGQTTLTFEMSSVSAIAPVRQQPSIHQQWTPYLHPSKPAIHVHAPPAQPQYSQYSQWHPLYYPQQPLMQTMVVNQSTIMNARTQQSGCFIRALYFIFVGWWLGLMWLGAALFFCLTIIEVSPR